MAKRKRSAAKGTTGGQDAAPSLPPGAYFISAFDLILSLYNIPPRDQAVADLREPLRGREAM